MKVLKENIKNKNFAKCYLLFGEENYLKKYYEHKLKNAIVSDNMDMMNTNVFEGKSISIDTIINASNTLPFMCEKRLVLIKFSELFQNGRKEDSDKMKGYLADIPNSTCIIFIEENVDKRNKLYKTIQKEGYIAELKSPKESDLIVWIQKTFKKYNIDIETKIAIYMLRNVGTDMDLLEGEIQKLIAYKNNENIINQTDIDIVCTKSLETKIFDMLDAIGNKNLSIALNIYNNMIMSKEAPIKILIMIIRQFRLLIQVKYLLSKSYNNDYIAQRLNQNPFVVKGFLAQVKNFPQEILNQAFEDCLETDISIKTGLLSADIAVELLIIKYGQ